MNRLPQEIYDEIATWGVERANRPNLATVSRQWQMAVERITFRQIYLTSSDLMEFKKIVSGHRLRFLGTILYSIVLPPHNKESHGPFQGTRHHQANYEAFTAAIYDLFSILRSWDDVEYSMMSTYSIRLEILDIYSPMRDGISSYVFRQELDVVSPHMVERESYLHLLRSDEWPVVPAINSLGVHLRSMRALSSQVYAEAVRKLPNLRIIDWFTYEENMSYPEQRQRNRDLFTKTLRRHLPEISNLHSLGIFMDHGKFCNRPWLPISLRPEKDSPDPLSRSIREGTASMENLINLTISGIFDESLLWPDLSVGIVEPFWQNLKHLNIKFHTTKPSGGGYFRARPQRESLNPLPLSPSNSQTPQGYSIGEAGEAESSHDGQYSDNREHQESPQPELLYIPDDETISPLIEAFGRAISQMRALELASLTTNIAMHVSLDSHRGKIIDSTWGIWFAVPGASFDLKLQERPAFYQNMEQRRLILDVRNWRPNEHLKSILRDVGQERHGQMLMEEYLDY